MIPRFRRRPRFHREWLRVASLGLVLAASAPADGPQKPVLATTPPADIALPRGWTESAPPASTKAFAPMLAADGDAVLATWLEPLSSGGHRVRFARWRAATWGAATTVREATTLFANWADVPGVVRAPDRSLYAWWLEKSGADTYAYDARLARSTDDGASFRPLGPLHEDRSEVEHGFVAAAPESAGVRFFYLDGRATANGAPMQLRSVYVEGDGIGASEIVDDAVCDCCSTAAAAIPAGTAIAYRDRTAAEIRDIRLAIRPHEGALFNRAVGDDGWRIDGCPVNGPALAARGRNLAVAWFTAPGDRARIRTAISLDGGRSLGPPRTIDAAQPLGRLSLATLPDGFAVAWLARLQEGAELRVARLDEGGVVNRRSTVARTLEGRGAGIPRLAATADRLALAWIDIRGEGLRFATTPLRPR